MLSPEKLIIANVETFLLLSPDLGSPTPVTFSPESSLQGCLLCAFYQLLKIIGVRFAILEKDKRFIFLQPTKQNFGLYNCRRIATGMEGVLQPLRQSRFNRLKQNRRIATRYEKKAENYLTMITLTSIKMWL